MGKKPTLQMIADLAGVSRGTVDRVINNRSYVKAEVRERVLRIAQETGYVSTREAHLRELEAEKKVLKLGVLLPDWGHGQQFWEGINQGIREAQEELEPAGVEILVRQCKTDLPQEAVNLLRDLHEQGAEGHASLDWRLEFNAANAPRTLSATADGRAAFAALAAHPPRFLYSPEWDTVRVVCRGMDSPSPSISGFIENIPLAIRIR